MYPKKSLANSTSAEPIYRNTVKKNVNDLKNDEKTIKIIKQEYTIY